MYDTMQALLFGFIGMRSKARAGNRNVKILVLIGGNPELLKRSLTAR